MEFKFYKTPWSPERYNDVKYCLDVVNETEELILDLAFGNHTEEETERCAKEIAEFMKILAIEQQEAYSDLVRKFSFYLGHHAARDILMFPSQLGMFVLKRGHYEYQ